MTDTKARSRPYLDEIDARIAEAAEHNLARG